MTSLRTEPDPTGSFGPFGGRYVPETLVAARDHVEEALAWMIEDGVARALEITVVAQGDVLGLGLAIQVAILHPGAATTTRFDFVWSAS